jgi:GrpB-like predicted nucleotidyltransferase (UPF0157 family)
MEEPVHIVAYDPTWPRRFVEERSILLQALSPWLAGTIEHVGSTAVPGLAAKPVIDIMAGVDSLEASRPAIARLSEHGYCYAPYRPDEMHWFCKPSPANRTHHLHLVPFQSLRWIEVLAFRNYLRTHADVAMEYERPKRGLAEQHQFDREAYTDAKGPFIQRIVDTALHV